MSKVIFFDVDGTIWDQRMVIPQSTKDAFKIMHENGHKLIMCTGRAMGSVRSKELLSLEFDGIIAACGTYIQMNGEVVYDQVLPPDMVKKVITVLKENHMPVVLEGSTDYWIDEFGFEEDPYVDYLFADLKDNAHVLKGYDPAIEVNKFSADILPETNMEVITAELEKDFIIMNHDGIVVEFLPRGYSKATGIEWLCNYLGVDIKETYAIGDSVNDLEMLEAVGHSIVMGDAKDFVKEKAEYVTDGIHEDGLYNAMKHYGLV